MILCIKINCI